METSGGGEILPSRNPYRVFTLFLFHLSLNVVFTKFVYFKSRDYRIISLLKDKLVTNREKRFSFVNPIELFY